MPDRIIEAIYRLSTTTPIRETKLRGSNIPLCAMAKALDVWTRCTGTSPLERRTLINDIILKTGHAVHAVWQEWLGHMNILYGNWVCRRCQKIRERSFDNICKFCKRVCEYEELYYQEPFGMKIDAPIKLGPSNEVNAILELKSMSQEVWEEITKAKSNHIMQVNAYAEVMQRDGFKIDHVAVVYLNRNRPWRGKTFVFKPQKVLDKLVSSYKRAEKNAQNGKIPAFKVVDDSCVFCPWTVVCESPNRERVVERILNGYLEATHENK